MEQFKLMFECKDCKKKFPVTQDQAPNSLSHKKEFISDGKIIFLTYYDCPYCDKRHFVQIDDTNSLQELAKVTNEFKSLMIKRQTGKTISKKQSDKFKKSRQHLSDYRMNLMKQFTGKLTTDETGKEYVLRFNM